MNAFESVRQRGVPLPITAPAATVVPQELVAARKWRIGPPPHAGWWKTRKGMAGAEWRWWDGQAWSWPVASNAGDAAIDKAMRPWGDAAAIVWCWDWPEGARVQRVNPATGVITGGEA